MVSPKAAGVKNVVAHRLGAGDRLRITVSGNEDLSVVFEIDSSGRISLPLIGSIEESLIDRTCSEAERLISEWLVPPSEFEPPQISKDVEVECYGYRTVCLVGVANPGCYPYRKGMSVITIIAMAGGFTYRAVEDQFIIKRDGKEIPVGPETLVMPGDVIQPKDRYF